MAYTEILKTLWLSKKKKLEKAEQDIKHNIVSKLTPTPTPTHKHTQTHTDFPGGFVVKKLLASAGDTGDLSSGLGLGRSPGGGNGNPV